ncbi:hypothetical protein LHP98_14725 [Rhodobacter sp. Har01]|uniref:hypothetical protein n=1 Tax=Rhodobacter sp. Har01 TaxID=2883999 RepID=UPI001D066E19|nr:hypothetical protein [Rhodobacter sp. Har01]MCB6179375.1 hypothetical protein [Rhodobacter sp. Har01]
MRSFLATLALFVLAAAPVPAQTMATLLPALSWPDDGVTASSKTCDTADAKAVCVNQE